MVRRWGLPLFGAVLAGAVLVATAGAIVQPSANKAPDFSSRAGVLKYLEAQGIDTKGIVIQRGAHNYAGPSCPGVRWNCTTAKRVVQIMFPTNNPGNQNQFTCTASSAPAPTNSYDCLIVQSSSGSDNNATCTEKVTDPADTQRCRIYQLNTTGANNAAVLQQVAAATGSTQDATQVTEIAQWAGSGSNNAQVNQDLKESQSVSVKTGATTQKQDGHQSTAVSQHSDSGNNTAKVLQSLQLKAAATGGTSITQLQNTTGGGPNISAAIYQNADQAPPATITSSGTNNAYIFQASDLNASGAKTGSLTQQQGAPSNGGFGHIEQWSTGVSTGQANQNEHQTLGSSQVSGAVTQNQYGPFWFDPNQGSNGADTLNVSQSSIQNAGPNANQYDALWGACGSTGVCSVTQKVANDKQNATNSCTSTPTSSCDIGVVLVSPPPSEGSNPYICSGECTFPPFDEPAPPSICDQIESAPPCVELTSTSTGLVQDVSCSSSGFPTTFTATVTPSPGATGSVDFKEGATVLSTVPLSPSGTAAYTTSSLPVGSHTITAVYSGGGSYAGSTSSSVTHDVAPGSCIF
jgi:hypothetical protein